MTIRRTPNPLSLAGLIQLAALFGEDHLPTTFGLLLRWHVPGAHTRPASPVERPRVLVLGAGPPRATAFVGSGIG